MHEHTSQQFNNIITLEEFLEELSRDDLAKANLAGYFDVLVEMDLELKEQERNDENGKEE